MENTAAHEAGHALLTVLREDITKRPVYITTILPRGGTLGHVLPVPKTDQHSENMAQMIAMIDIAMAGRVGEELHFGFVSSSWIINSTQNTVANITPIAKCKTFVTLDCPPLIFQYDLGALKALFCQCVFLGGSKVRNFVNMILR